MFRRVRWWQYKTEIARLQREIGTLEGYNNALRSHIAALYTELAEAKKGDNRPRPFSCDVCGAKFLNKQGLGGHRYKAHPRSEKPVDNIDPSTLGVPRAVTAMVVSSPPATELPKPTTGETRNCEYCSYRGKRVAAYYSVGTDSTPVCLFHLTHGPHESATPETRKPPGWIPTGIDRPYDLDKARAAAWDNLG